MKASVVKSVDTSEFLIIDYDANRMCRDSVRFFTIVNDFNVRYQPCYDYDYDYDTSDEANRL